MSPQKSLSKLYENDVGKNMSTLFQFYYNQIEREERKISGILLFLIWYFNLFCQHAQKRQHFAKFPRMLNPLDLPVNEINGRRKKNYLFFFKSSQKNGFCCAREGGNFRDWSATNRDFFMRDVGLLDCFSPHAIFIYFKETNNNSFSPPSIRVSNLQTD